MNENELISKEYQELKAILNEINQKISRQNLPPEDIVYDNVDALRILKVSSRTLLDWRTSGKISYSQVGAKIYYTQKDISEFMKKNSRSSFAKFTGI